MSYKKCPTCHQTLVPKVAILDEEEQQFVAWLENNPYSSIKWPQNLKPKLLHKDQVEFQDWQSIIIDACKSKILIEKYIKGLFYHPDNIRYMYEKFNKTLPNWITEKYSQYFISK